MIELVLLQGALMTAFGSGLLIGYFLNTLIGYMNKQSYTVVCVDKDHVENDEGLRPCSCHQVSVKPDQSETQMPQTTSIDTLKNSQTTTTKVEDISQTNTPTDVIQPTTTKIEAVAPTKVSKDVDQPEPDKPADPVKEPFEITPGTFVKQYESCYGRPYNTRNEQEFLEYEGEYIKQLRKKPNVNTKIPERNVYEDYKPRKEQYPKESRRISRLKRQHVN